jgi:chromosome segregation ATPase
MIDQKPAAPDGVRLRRSRRVRRRPWPLDRNGNTGDAGPSGYVTTAAAVDTNDDTSGDDEDDEEDEDEETTDDEDSDGDECDFQTAITTLKTLRRGQSKRIERFSAQLRTLEQAHQSERARADTLLRQQEADKEKIAALEEKTKLYDTLNSETFEKFGKFEKDLAEAEKLMERERRAHKHALEELIGRNQALRLKQAEQNGAVERWKGYASSLMENLDNTEELRIAANNVVNFDAQKEGPSLWGLLDDLHGAVRKLESGDKVKQSAGSAE